LAAELVDPSPKSHAYVYGVMPPVTVEVNCTVSPTAGLVGENVKSTDSAVVEIAIVAEFAAVCEFASVTVKETVKDPGVL